MKQWKPWQRANDAPWPNLYRQFIQNYTVNVLSLRHADFEDIFGTQGADLISYYKSFIEKQPALFSRKVCSSNCRAW
jgi:hypothetical protein